MGVDVKDQEPPGWRESRPLRGRMCVWGWEGSKGSREGHWAGYGRVGVARGAGRSVTAGKRWGSKHLEGSLGQRQTLRSLLLPQSPAPTTPAPSYKGPRPKQGVQAVEVPWPSHTCCHGCCSCPYSVVRALVSPPSLPLLPHPPGLGVEGALQTAPPFAEPWFCPKHYP